MDTRSFSFGPCAPLQGQKDRERLLNDIFNLFHQHIVLDYDSYTPIYIPDSKPLSDDGGYFWIPPEMGHWPRDLEYRKPLSTRLSVRLNFPTTIAAEDVKINLVPTLRGDGSWGIQFNEIAPVLSPTHNIILPRGRTLFIDVPLKKSSTGARCDALFFITPKASSSGVKRAPGAPELETEPGNILPGRTYTRPTSTRGAYPKFEFGVGYSHMQTDGEEVGQLNGFNTSAFYHVNPWLAVGGQFSGLYGTKTIGDVDVSLDRYLYLFGARVSAPVAEPVRLVGFYAQVLLGGVHDSNNVSFKGGSSSSSADAFAMSLGVGADFQVTNSFSLGPSFDYVPTNFSGANGNNWQNNWSVNLNARINFGGK